MNSKAASCGINLGMMLSDARALAPDLRSELFCADKKRRYLNILRNQADDYSPEVALDDDGLFIEIAGVSALFGGEAALLRRVMNDFSARNLTVCGAIAATPLAARAFARSTKLPNLRATEDIITLESNRRMVIVSPGATKRAVAALPISHLNLDEATVNNMARLNLRHIDQLLSIPPKALFKRFSYSVSEQLQRMTGQIYDVLDYCPLAEDYALRFKMVNPVSSIDYLISKFAFLLQNLSKKLEEVQLTASKIVLHLIDVNSNCYKLPLVLSSSSFSDKYLHQLLLIKFDGLQVRDAIDEIAVIPQLLSKVNAQQTSLRDIKSTEKQSQDSDQSYDFLIQCLSNKLGQNRVLHIGYKREHSPENRFTLKAALLFPKTDRNAAAHYRRSYGGQFSKQGEALRPLVLITPRPVITERGKPKYIRWGGENFDVELSQPQPIAPEWWKSQQKYTTQRCYWNAYSSCGRKFWLFNSQQLAHVGEDVESAWYLHGEFA